MKDETVVKLSAMGFGTAICIVALLRGIDSNLALAAVVALFGGEQVVNRVRKVLRK